MTAALLATGNEVVSGQILNRNASWLARKLSEKGINVRYHLAALDSREDLLASLGWITDQGVDHIFITGGLGPTRDDLTRQIVADFCGLEFSFEDELWSKLESSLNKRNITPREGHKWQCYFPDGSLLMENSLGTAWGFSCEKVGEKLRVWALPGPPQELESVFSNGIEPWISKNVNPSLRLITWQCFNIPESELAHRVELTLEGCNYELGFRASPPITEVKLWVPLSEYGTSNPWIQKLDDLCAPMLYSKDGQDYFGEVMGALDIASDQSFQVRDALTGNYFFNLANESSFLRSLGLEFSIAPLGEAVSVRGMSLGLGPSGKGLLKLNWANLDYSFEVPEISRDLLEKSSRSQRYVLYKTIKELHGQLFQS